MVGLRAFGGRMSDPVEKEYYCAYCHTSMNHTDRCECCGSRDKRCKSCNSHSMKQHDTGTIDGGDK